MKNKNELEYLRNKVKELESKIKNNVLQKSLSKDESIGRKILEHSTNAFYSHTTDHKLTYFSPQVLNILGYTPDEVLIKWTDTISDNPMNNDGLKKTTLAIETGKAQKPYELELIHKSGRKVYVEVHEAPVVEKGKTVAIVGALTDITKRKIAVNNLKESEEKFRLLFEKSQDPILIIDDYNFVECNDATVKILGYSSNDEIFNIHPSKLSPKYQPDGKLSYEKAQEMMDIAYTTGYHRFEWIHLNKNGKEIFMDVSLTRIPYKRKDMIFTVWRNISKQKENEKNIIEKGKQISALFEQAADGILVGTRTGKIIEANESILKLTAYKKEELIGNNINILFKKEQLNIKPLRYDLVKQGNTIIIERNIVRKDGKIIPIEMKTKILDDGRMQALIRDLTKRKKAEKALKESEEKYRNIFHYSPLGIIHYDKNGEVKDCNDSFVKLIGSSKEALIGWNILKNAKDEKIKKSIKESIEKGESYYEDWYSSITAKKLTFVRILFKGIKDINNKIVSGIGLVEDITERKQIEQRIYNAVLETEQKERQRLASDLHDEIGPLLSSLKMYIESLNEQNDATKQKYIKSQLKSLIKESIINVREVSNALSPYLLSKYGMNIAIKSFLKNSKELIKNSFETNLNEERFSINVETVFYRIIKELFNNTIKHASAKNIKISLKYLKNSLILIYEDDGNGIKKDDLKNIEYKGMGLMNITNRIKSINGNYKFYTDYKSGFKFHASKKTEILKN